MKLKIIAAVVGLGVFILIAIGLVGNNQSAGVPSQPADESLGSTRYPNGLISSYLQVTDVGAVAVASSTFGTDGSLTAGGCWSRNGLDSCEISGSFTDASSTIFAILNPHRATTTVTMGALTMTGAASTSLNFYVGSSTVPTVPLTGLNCTTGAPTICDGSLVDEAVLATSSAASGGSFTGSLGSLITNGVIGGDGFASWGLSNPITLGPDEWLVGYATTTFRSTSSYNELNCENGGCADGGSDGITNTGNSFDGNYFFGFVKW